MSRRAAGMRRAGAAVGLGVLAFWGAALALDLPRASQAPYSSRPDLLPSGPEALHALLASLLGATIWLALRRLPEASLYPVQPVRPRVLVAAASLHAGMLLLTGSLITRFAPLTDDEAVYRLQARMLARGSLSEPAPPLREAIANPFVIDAGVVDGQTWWAGCYPLMAGLWTLPGELIGAPHLLWLLLGPALVWQSARLAEELWPNIDGALVAGMLALSPALIGLGVHLHTSLGAALLSVLIGRMLCRPRPLRQLGLGLCLGLLVLTRPLDGALLFLLVGGVWLHRLRARPGSASWAALARIGLGGLPCLLAWMYTNQALTGHALHTPYDLLFDGQAVYGFGETAYGPHDLWRAAFKTITALMRLELWTLGVGIALALALCLRQQWQDPISRLLVAMGILHLLAYAGAPFGAMPGTGTTYHIVLIPLALLLLARGQLHQRWEGRLRASALLIAAMLTSLPLLAAGLRATADAALAPPRAAAQAVDAHGPIVILHDSLRHPAVRSVVYHPPLPTGLPEAIWLDVSADPSAVRRARARWPERTFLRGAWDEGHTRYTLRPIESAPSD